MREWLLRMLRVPPRPTLPSAGPEPVRVFRAAAAWLNYRRLRWAVTQAGALAGLLFGLYWLNTMPDVLWTRFFPSGLGERIGRLLVTLVEAGAWVGYAGQAVGSLLLLRLDWDQRWYLVSDRSLRVREGLIRLHEKTTTFDNIQNVTIRQGPLQRLFGIADVEVKSAGGGGSKGDDGSEREDLHTVWFRGVADAPAIRDTILRRVQQVREGRLDAEPAEGPADPLSRLNAAADALRAEAVALGRARLRLPPRAPGERLT
jgi:hypothetical protein